MEKREKKYAVIIPARYESSRLPGKPLLLINGIPMIVRTYMQVNKVVSAKDIYVATDDQRIRDLCISKNMNCIMTGKECLTGTDRVFESSLQLEYEYFINVQGDEPILNPNDLSTLINYCEDNNFYAVNGYSEISCQDDYYSSSVPKLVFDEQGYLLYMSRAPIPSSKNKSLTKAYRQICIYSFSREALKDFSLKKSKSFFENIEDIEILRFLEMGKKIKMIPMSGFSISVDNPEDIIRVESKLNESNSFI